MRMIVYSRIFKKFRFVEGPRYTFGYYNIHALLSNTVWESSKRLSIGNADHYSKLPLPFFIMKGE